MSLSQAIILGSKYPCPSGVQVRPLSPAIGGEIIGIEVLDHIIIGDKSFVSLKARNLF